MNKCKTCKSFRQHYIFDGVVGFTEVYSGHCVKCIELKQIKTCDNYEEYDGEKYGNIINLYKVINKLNSLLDYVNANFIKIKDLIDALYK